MQSILRQLSKYADPIPAVPIIEVPPTQDDPILVAIRKILNYPQISKVLYEREIDEIYRLMAGYTPSKFVGTLFPLTVDVAYFLFYVRKKQITTEVIIDNELFNFLQTVDKTVYMTNLFKNADNAAQKLFLARVLFATCKSDNKWLRKRDILPIEYQAIAATKLGCRADIKTASNLIDYLSKSATPEQIIIGRIAYLAFWHLANNRINTNENLDMLNNRCLMLP